MDGTKTVKLNLPISWSRLSVQQLETVARCITRSEQTAAISLSGQADKFQIKTQLFFPLAGLSVLVHHLEDSDGTYSLCCLADEKKKDYEHSFKIYSWQVYSCIEKYMAWLDTPCSGLVTFPYPILTLHNGTGRGIKFHGPSALMQDFTWRRFRVTQDYLQLYVQQQNILVSLGRKNMMREKNLKAYTTMLRSVGDVRAKFLSMLFTCEHDIAEEKVYGYLRNIDDTRFQVILFWWNGMMQYLHGSYPHFYQKTSVSKNNKTNPLSLYARMTATIEKHVGLNEREVNDENFHVVLQHMEDICVTNDEYEKIRNQN